MFCRELKPGSEVRQEAKRPHAKTETSDFYVIGSINHGLCQKFHKFLINQRDLKFLTPPDVWVA